MTAPADQRPEVEMSPAEFLADIEVAVTDRSIELPRNAGATGQEA